MYNHTIEKFTPAMFIAVVDKKNYAIANILQI